MGEISCRTFDKHSVMAQQFRRVHFVALIRLDDRRRSSITSVPDIVAARSRLIDLTKHHERANEFSCPSRSKGAARV